MIFVNDNEINWRSGMTVRDAMNEMHFSFPLVVVTVNGEIVPQNELETHVLMDNDKVVVFHLTSGG